MIDKDGIVAALRQLQQDCCGMCGDPETENGRLEIDHDHDTGMVRGLLCRSCNNHEGQHGRCRGRESECPVCLWRLTPATSYLGWTVRYTKGPGSPFARKRRGYAPTSVRRLEGVRRREAMVAATSRMFPKSGAA